MINAEQGFRYDAVLAILGRMRYSILEGTLLELSIVKYIDSNINLVGRINREY